MDVVLVLFMFGITQITGRPNNGSNKLNSVDNLEEIPPWPQFSNTYLLPKKLKVDDIINVTALISNSPKFNISLIAESRTGTASVFSKAICTLMADTESGTVELLDDKEQPLTDADEVIDLPNFFLNDDENIFNVWFRRRNSDIKQNNNILEIRSSSFSKLLKLHHVNDIRSIKFTGENIKVTELEFKYAIN